MTWNDVLTVWSSSIWVSSVVWAVFGVVLLYLARARVHAMLKVASSALARWLRAAARMSAGVRGRLQAQQRLLVAALAQDLAQRRIERGFRRLADAVERDLATFPQLQRRVTDEIERIDRDYHESADTPPAPPQWLEAVDTIARTQASADPAVATILDAMHGTLARSTHDALDEFRFASRKRHGLLRRMLPHWRRAARTLAHMEADIAVMRRRAESLDAQVDRYALLRDDPPALTLGVQAQYWVRCVVSVALLTLLALLALTEYTVLRAPLLELLPNAARVLGAPLATVEAWIVVGGEVAFGMLLLEINRVTRLLPVLGLPQRRVRLAVSILLVLFWLGTVAFAAELVAMGGPVLPTLAAHKGAAVGIVVLLALLLLPFGVVLESALSAGRGVLLSLASGLLALLALVLRAGGWVARLGGQVLIYAYDLVIFLPLVVETALEWRRRRTLADKAEVEEGAPAAQ